VGGTARCCCAARPAPEVSRQQGSNERPKGFETRGRQGGSHNRRAAGRREGIGAASSRCSQTLNTSGRQGCRAKAAKKRRERREARVFVAGEEAEMPTLQQATGGVPRAPASQLSVNQPSHLGSQQGSVVEGGGGGWPVSRS